jgi:adenylylsulfate kinase
MRQECPFISGLTLWLTGLPCAGKSTLAVATARELERHCGRVEVLDADVLRATLCKDLGFSRKDREENVARLGWVCNTLNSHGVATVVAAVSPYRESRQLLRDTIPIFVEVYVRAPLSVCIERDVKGMYARALAGEISGFTGIDDPYEEPLAPDIVLDTTLTDIAGCVDLILAWLAHRSFVQLGAVSRSVDAAAKPSGTGR